MASYAYQGQSAGGHKVGTIDAASADAAAQSLRSQGILPFDIAEIRPAQEAWWKRLMKSETQAHSSSTTSSTTSSTSAKDALKGIFQTSWGKKVPIEEVMMFARQLHVLMRAGVPIIGGLGSLREACLSPVMRDVLVDIIAKLESGRPLSECMALHPAVFDEFFIAMVRVGEETGRLDDVFWALYERMEFDERIRRQIKSATRYPIFVLVAISAALAVVNLFVIPAFEKVFSGMGAQLPLLTRVLMGTSRFAQDQLPWIILALAFMAYGFFKWIKTPHGKLTWHGFLLKIPLFGSIILKASIARFCRGMALSMGSGVAVLQALSIVARTADNEWLAERLLGMRDSIERGGSVLSAAQDSGVFPPMVLQMVAVGDQSGRLDDMMNEVASSYTKDVQYELQTFSQRLEPILIAFMGVLVLILALGIFLPIWDLGRVTIKN